MNTYKNPGSSSLRSVLKYAVPRASRTEIPEASSENQPESEVAVSKKRKTLPFAQLLTNEESWQRLNKLNEEAEAKIEEKRKKKELTAQRKAAREQELAKKREEHEQRKQEKENQKRKKQ